MMPETIGVNEESTYRKDRIIDRAYTDLCCQRFENVNYAYPVIDFDKEEVTHYEALMPFLNEQGDMDHRREVWHFCPFCGKPLHRMLGGMTDE